MDEEIRELERRVASEPRDPVLLEELVRALVRAGRVDDARARCEHALDAREGGAGGAELVGALRAARVPLRAVPLGDAQLLVAVTGSRIHAVAPLPFNPATPAVVGERFVAGLCLLEQVAGTPRRTRSALLEGLASLPVPGGDLVDVFELASGLPRLAGAPFGLGEAGLRGRGVALVGSALYVGGDPRVANRLVVIRDLDAPEARWRTLDVRVGGGGPGKMVEALLPGAAGRLVAVGNGTSPHTHFLLDVTSPLVPSVLTWREVAAHGEYEHVFATSGDGRHVALLGRRGVGAGAVSYIALCDADSLREVSFFENPPGWTNEPETWHDVVVTGERLAVARGEGGVLVVDLSDREPDPAAPTATESSSPEFDTDEALMRLTALDEHRCIATFERERRAVRHALVALDPPPL